MEDRIKKLMEKGYFKFCSIDEKGFGTFRNPSKSSQGIQNEALTKASTLKKEADLVNKNDKNSAIKIYIEAMFFYIKGYREEEAKITKSKIIVYYRGLFKYTLDIYKMINEDLKLKKFIYNVLISIKFHFVSLETKSVESELCKNIYELYVMCQRNENVLKLDDLETIYKSTF